ncbi:hypothetical protein BJ508DRAFT_379482 [Ascobolus immersus RN42]|uniref:Increased recombination centers protein 6 n=1 Tax=Ascobolus immersus RN42 TaxID=1160509 RepID=A0A3N4HRP5_ASCIM|nr:hypothetical protein BJ508DRAFT_379482 [Ascobolus immersus RN42]
MSSPPIPLIAPPENPPPLFFTAGTTNPFPSVPSSKPKPADKPADTPDEPAPPPSPLRLLILGAPKSGKLTLLKTLTGSLPPLATADASHAGLSHELRLKTNYYNLTVPVWIDELPADAGELEKWAVEFLSEEAKEVREVLGGVVYVFREDRGVEEVVREVRVVGFVVRMPGRVEVKIDEEEGEEEGDDADKAEQETPRKEGKGEEADKETPKEADSTNEKESSKLEPTPTKSKTIADMPNWKDLLEAPEGGYEVVSFTDTTRDDYGDTTGLERLREGLEANDWTGSLFAPGINGIDDDELGLGDDGDEEEDGEVSNEMLEEMSSLRKALLGEAGKVFEEMDEEEQEGEVERFEAMVLRLQGLKVKGGR